MKLFILIHERDTDSEWGAAVSLFTRKAAAQEAMRTSWKNTIKEWNFDVSSQTEECNCACGEETCTITDGTDFEHWRIEERSLNVEVAVQVKNGLVQEIYANADVSAEVCDLDAAAVSGEDDGLLEQLEDLIRAPGWQSIYRI